MHLAGRGSDVQACARGGIDVVLDAVRARHGAARGVDACEGLVGSARASLRSPLVARARIARLCARSMCGHTCAVVSVGRVGAQTVGALFRIACWRRARELCKRFDAVPRTSPLLLTADDVVALCATNIARGSVSHRFARGRRIDPSRRRKGLIAASRRNASRQRAFNQS